MAGKKQLAICKNTICKQLGGTQAKNIVKNPDFTETPRLKMGNFKRKTTLLTKNYTGKAAILEILAKANGSGLAVLGSGKFFPINLRKSVISKVVKK